MQMVASYFPELPERPFKIDLKKTVFITSDGLRTKQRYLKTNIEIHI